MINKSDLLGLYNSIIPYDCLEIIFEYLLSIGKYENATCLFNFSLVCRDCNEIFNRLVIIQELLRKREIYDNYCKYVCTTLPNIKYKHGECRKYFGAMEKYKGLSHYNMGILHGKYTETVYTVRNEWSETAGMDTKRMIPQYTIGCTYENGVIHGWYYESEDVLGKATGWTSKQAYYFNGVKIGVEACRKTEVDDITAIYHQYSKYVLHRNMLDELIIFEYRVRKATCIVNWL